MSLYNSDFGSEKIRTLLSGERLNIFFSGVLGAGMLPLAELMAGRGACIFGNDRGEYSGTLPFLKRLEPLSDVGHVDLAVYSLAIPEDDADIAEAVRRDIPLVSRAELLGAVMLDYPMRIGIAGAHGKSTTVAMLDCVLRGAGMKGITLSGARLPSGDALRADGEDFFVFEACEYKNSFLKMHPTSAVVTNIELDHTDFFKSEEELVRSFTLWGESTEKYTVIGEGGTLTPRVLAAIHKKVYTVGSGENADFRYKTVGFSDTGCRFDLDLGGKHLGSFSLAVLGEHNIMNAASALAIAYLHGVDITLGGLALSRFAGIPRRQEYLGRISGRAVYYDYAHHPTEIRCTLRTLKAKEGGVTCIFRPHTYTRTASLWDEFANALREADSSVILDIYPAREEPIPGIDPERLAASVGDRCTYKSFCDVVNYCLHYTTGAIVLMGAGDVEEIKEELTALMEK